MLTTATGHRPHPLFLGHRGIDSQPYLGKGFSFSTKAFCPPPTPILRNKLEAIPMINYQLLNVLPLAISGKGMNYLGKTSEKRTHREGESERLPGSLCGFL